MSEIVERCVEHNLVVLTQRVFGLGEVENDVLRIQTQAMPLPLLFRPCR